LGQHSGSTLHKCRMDLSMQAANNGALPRLHTRAQTPGQTDRILLR
jgi:hypothetical protein